MLAVFSLASCSSDDNNEDKVEQVTLYVSAETGTYQNVPDNNSLSKKETDNTLETRGLTYSYPFYTNPKNAHLGCKGTIPK
jgi:hypothetical protein